MKTLGKLKLTQLSKSEIGKRELNKLSGGAPGECCICAYGQTNYNGNTASGQYSASLMGAFNKAG